MPDRKRYIRPEITRVKLDNSICLMQMSPGPPGNPNPRSGSSGKGEKEPFQTPFGDKPFG